MFTVCTCTLHMYKVYTEMFECRTQSMHSTGKYWILIGFRQLSLFQVFTLTHTSHIPHTHTHTPYTLTHSTRPKLHKHPRTLSSSSLPEHWYDISVSVTHSMRMDVTSVSLTGARGWVSWHYGSPRSVVKALLHFSTFGWAKQCCKTVECVCVYV